MNDDITRILERAKKLQKHADSAAEVGYDAEAANYAAAMHRLLAKHRLSMEQVDAVTLNAAEPIEKINAPCGREDRHRPEAWVTVLGTVVASNFGRALLSVRGTNCYRLAGRRSSVAVASYTFETLVRMATRAADRNASRRVADARKAGRRWSAKGYRQSFYNAFVLRIDARFHAMKEAKDAQAGAIVLMKRDAEDTEAWLQEAGVGNADPVTFKRTTRSDAVRDGFEAAEAADLEGRALGGSGQPRQKTIGGAA